MSKNDRIATEASKIMRDKRFSKTNRSHAAKALAAQRNKK